MPFTSWEIYFETNIDGVPDVFGVFETSNSTTDLSKITYIGRGRIRTELRRYRKDSCIGTSMYFRYEQTSSDERAQERERALLREFEEKYGHLPKCNKRIG